MKRRQDDVAMRLLQDYLDHIESWIASSSETDRQSVVVHVIEHRRRIPRLAESNTAGTGSSRLLP
jgi:hypothetical protein